MTQPEPDVTPLSRTTVNRLAILLTNYTSNNTEQQRLAFLDMAGLSALQNKLPLQAETRTYIYALIREAQRAGTPKDSNNSLFALLLRQLLEEIDGHPSASEFVTNILTVTSSNSLKVLSDSQSPPKISTVEYLLLLDWIFYQAISLRGPGETYGWARRIIEVLDKLSRKASYQLPLVIDELKEPLAIVVRSFVESTLPAYLTEALVAVPQAEDKGLPLDDSYWKNIARALKSEWFGFIEKELEKDITLFKAIAHLKAEGVRIWTLVGFENQTAYQRYLMPTFDELRQQATEIDRILLQEIIDKDEANVRELESQGFAKGYLVETINMLLRSKFLDLPEKGEVFPLNNVGKRLISAFLKGETR